jgi:hypothetical protein
VEHRRNIMCCFFNTGPHDSNQQGLGYNHHGDVFAGFDLGSCASSFIASFVVYRHCTKIAGAATTRYVGNDILTTDGAETLHHLQ